MFIHFGFDDGCKNLKNCIDKSKIIITAIPFSKDGKYVFAPLSTKCISIDEFVNLASDKIIIGGSFKEEYIKKFNEKQNHVIDIMKDESFALNNTIPTAEGVIKIIIENTDITIDKSNIAVLGFGRVGKKVAELLKSLNANVFCYDNKEEELANINSSGYNVLGDICGSLNNMDVIINTVPSLILEKSNLNFVNKETLIIDVSSKPGGIDFDYAKEHNYNVIHALGLPGKVAPRTSAKYIKELLRNIII